MHSIGEPKADEGYSAVGLCLICLLSADSTGLGRVSQNRIFGDRWRRVFACWMSPNQQYWSIEGVDKSYSLSLSAL